jgi:hypothetical protein
MSRLGGAARERFVELNTATLGAPARGDSPHLLVSPRTAAGLVTGSLALVLLPTSGSDGAWDGFDITIYRAVPTLGDWGKFQVYPSAAYRDQLILNDVSGGLGLFFSIVAPNGDGRILVGVAEQA